MPKMVPGKLMAAEDHFVPYQSHILYFYLENKSQ